MTSMIHGKGNGPATEQMLRPRHPWTIHPGTPSPSLQRPLPCPHCFWPRCPRWGQTALRLDGNDGNDGYDGNIAAAEGVKAVDGVLWGGKFSLSGSSKQMQKPTHDSVECQGSLQSHIQIGLTGARWCFWLLRVQRNLEGGPIIQEDWFHVLLGHTWTYLEKERVERSICTRSYCFQTSRGPKQHGHCVI